LSGSEIKEDETKKVTLSHVDAMGYMEKEPI
jgi:hypothetical protein